MIKKAILSSLHQPIPVVLTLVIIVIFVGMLSIGGTIVVMRQHEQIETLSSPFYEQDRYIKPSPPPRRPYFIISNFTSPDLGIGFYYLVFNDYGCHTECCVKKTPQRGSREQIIQA